MLIDTHCHLLDGYVNTDDIAGMVQRARDAGVGALIVPCADAVDAPKAVALVEQYDNLYCMVGIHPEFAEKIKPSDATEDYKLYLAHPRVLGVGEIGLDYHDESPLAATAKPTKRRNAPREAQIELFCAQLDIACDARLPVAIHSRRAQEDTVKILCDPKYSNLGDGVPGVMHFHCMSWDFTKKLLDRGFYFSATGIITFKNADDIREVFRKLPADRIVIETDAPWCAPVPYRGKVCEPFMIVETAKVLARIRGVQLPELENIMMGNTRRLYPKLEL